MSRSIIPNVAALESDTSPAEDPKWTQAILQVRLRLEVLLEKQKATGKEVSQFSEEVMAVLNKIMYDFIIQRSHLARNITRNAEPPSFLTEFHILALLARRMLNEEQKGMTVEEILAVLPNATQKKITRAILRIKENLLENRLLHASYQIVYGERKRSFKLRKNPLAGQPKQAICYGGR